MRRSCLEIYKNNVDVMIASPYGLAINDYGKKIVGNHSHSIQYYDMLKQMKNNIAVCYNIKE